MSKALEPCPFCGGEPEIHEKYMSPTMNGRSEIISAEVRHFCPKREGQPHGMSVKQIGRDRESAIKAWNTRTALQRPAVDVEKPHFDLDESLKLFDDFVEYEQKKYGKPPMIIASHFNRVLQYLHQQGYLSTGHDDKYQALVKERDDLREALEQIARTDIHGYVSPYYKPQDIAKQALKGDRNE